VSKESLFALVIWLKTEYCWRTIRINFNCFFKQTCIVENF